MKPGVCGMFIVISLAFAACGGGGGGSSNGGVTPTPPPTSTSTPKATPTATAAPTATATPTATAMPTATPTMLAVSGTAQEYVSGSALAGFTVTIGAVPNAATCLNAESATAMPCGVPASPQPTITTSPTGAFSIAVPAAGTYMLTIGKDATYATLHRTIVVAANTPLALGIVKVAALTTDEQAWLIDVNNQRATVSVPTSFANLVVDEYAEEQARAVVAAIASGAASYGDPTGNLYGERIAASPGAVYFAFNGALDLVSASSAYIQADTAWMAEKINCPNGWQLCAFAANTGHYINVSNTDDVWVGMGESSRSFVDPPYGDEWAYALYLPSDTAENAPASLGIIGTASF